MKRKNISYQKLSQTSPQTGLPTLMMKPIYTDYGGQSLDALEQHLNQVYLSHQASKLAQRKRQARMQYLEEKQNQIDRLENERNVLKKAHLRQMRLKVKQLETVLQQQNQKLRICYTYARRPWENIQRNSYNPRFQSRTSQKYLQILSQMTKLALIKVFTAVIRVSQQLYLIAHLMKLIETEKDLKDSEQQLWQYYIQFRFQDFQLEFNEPEKLSLNTQINKIYSQLQVTASQQVFMSTFKEINDEIQVVGVQAFKLLFNVIQYLKKLIQQGILDQLFSLMSCFLLNRSFLLDGVFVKQQLYRIKVDPKNQMTTLDTQRQLNFINNFLFVKIIAYGLLFQGSKRDKDTVIQQNLSTIRKLQKESESQIQSEPNNHKRNRMIAGGMLYFICSELHPGMFLDEIWKKQGNLQQVNQLLVPLPMQELSIPEENLLFAAQKRNRLMMSNKHAITNLNKTDIAIENVGKLKDYYTKVSNQPTSQQMKQLIKQLTLQCHQKCMQMRKKNLIQIKKNVWVQKQKRFSLVNDQKPRNLVQQNQVQNLMNLFKLQRVQNQNAKTSDLVSLLTKLPSNILQQKLLSTSSVPSSDTGTVSSNTHTVTSNSKSVSRNPQTISSKTNTISSKTNTITSKADTVTSKADTVSSNTHSATNSAGSASKNSLSNASGPSQTRRKRK